VRVVPHFVAELDEGGLGAVDAVRVSDRKSTLWLDAWRDLRGRWMFWVSAAVILFVIFVAFFPSAITQADPKRGELSVSNAGPAPGHPLGYTKQGYDILSRIAHGTAVSLSVGLISTLITLVIGVLVGAFSGFFGGWIDAVLMRISDMFYAIPYVIAAVVVMSIFLNHRNVLTMSLAIGAFAWPAVARIQRGEVLRIRRVDYVMASQALGLSRFRTMLRHVMPNSVSPVIVITTLNLAAAITAEATLDFLGVGLNDAISWGNDIQAALPSIRDNPMPLIYPSIALTVTVLAFILLGEMVREALDPKARASR
jgi:oligopeptide transport system permease protein